MVTSQNATVALLALAVVVLGSIPAMLRSLRRAAVGRPAPPPKRMSPRTLLIFGVAMLTGGVWWFAATAPSVARYNGDPVCRAEFSASATAYGECRLVRATIVDAYVGGRRSRTYYVAFRTSDGFERTTAVTKNRSGDVWAGARRSNDRAATIQLFGARVALIRTASGVAETDGLPAHVLTMAATLAIFGAVSIILALFQIMPGARVGASIAS